MTWVEAARAQLAGRWGGADGYASAVLAAAVDATLLGVRGPLPVEYLRAAAPRYCTEPELADAWAGWFDAALAGVTGPLDGRGPALVPAAADGGGYGVTVEVVPAASARLEYRLVPAGTWVALAETITDPNDAASVGHAAGLRALYGVADVLLRRAIDAGNKSAVWQLVLLLKEREDLAGLRELASAGHDSAVHQLAELLGRRGDVAGLWALIEAGGSYVRRDTDECAGRAGRRGGVAGDGRRWEPDLQPRRCMGTYPPARAAAGRGG